MFRIMSFLLLAGIFLSGCAYFPPDNPIEELIEKEIDNLTGLDIDLSADDEKI